MLRDLNISEMEIVSGGTTGDDVGHDADARGLNGYTEFGGIGFGGVMGLSDSMFGDSGFLGTFGGDGNFNITIGSGDVTISAYPIEIEADLLTVEFNLWEHLANSPGFKDVPELVNLWNNRTRHFPDGGGECTLPCN